jgi:hypothetical protein
MGICSGECILIDFKEILTSLKKMEIPELTGVAGRGG